jgi:hypothetical protein
MTILMETDCNHRELKGEFVYGWANGDLILLPCCSEIYQNATKNTTLKTSKFSAREFGEGRSYTTKNSEEVIYMGRMSWTEWPTFYCVEGEITTKKKHIFWNVSDEQFEAHDGASKIAHQNSDQCVPNYAELTDWLDITPCKSNNLIIDLEPAQSPKLKVSAYSQRLSNFYKEKDGELYWLSAYYQNSNPRLEGFDLPGEYLISILGVTSIVNPQPKIFTVNTDWGTHSGGNSRSRGRYSYPSSLDREKGDYVQEHALKILGLTSIFRLPEHDQQEAKDKFFGALVTPFISVPGGARREFDKLNLPNTQKPWKPHD